MGFRDGVVLTFSVCVGMMVLSLQSSCGNTCAEATAMNIFLSTGEGPGLPLAGLMQHCRRVDWSAWC